MKKGLLLSAAALCAMSMMAQDNYAPVNWRFDQMNVGSAEAIFVKSMASAAWNCKAPYRGADDGMGGIALSNNGANGESADTQDGWTNKEATLEYFEDFYDNARIVSLDFTDAGEAWTENVLCLIGNQAPEGYTSYAGGQARTKSFGNATMFWLSGNEESKVPMVLGVNYRMTIDCRVITKNEADQMDFTLATSAYDGIDQNTGLGNGGYRQASLPIYSATNDYWNRIIFDFKLHDNTAADYKELPFAIKWWLGDMADVSTILIRTIKLERIDEVDPINIPAYTEDYPTYTDKPGTVSVGNVLSNGVIVSAANGAITVIDADAAIEVYNLSGALVKKVAAPATVETVEMEGNGVYIVKVGETAKKVIL